MSNDVPKVSICCAYFNRSTYLRETLDSLLAQDYGSFEVVLVNDGSTDLEVERILSTYSDPRLRVIHQANTGFVGAIRRAIDESKGEYIAIQGAGDVSYPNRVRIQAQVLDDNLDIGIVSCRQQNLIVGGAHDGKRSLSRLVSVEPTIDILAGKHSPIIHGEVMFRRGLYDKVGGYRSFFTFSQDRDMFLRMAQFCKIRVLDEVLYQRNHFHVDGVNSNGEKAIQQRALTLFAIQCHYDRLKYGYDLLEQYGHMGFLFRKKSKKLANTAAERALECLVRGNLNGADICSRAGMDEAKTLKTIVSFLVVNAGLRVPLVTRLVKSANSVRHRLL